MPEKWLVEAALKWKPEILSGMGTWALSRRSGLTRHKCGQIIGFVTENPDFEADAADADNSGDDLLSDRVAWHMEDTDEYVTILQVTGGRAVVIPGYKHRAMIAAYSNWDGHPATVDQISREFGFPRPWVTEYLRKWGITHDHEPFSKEEVTDGDPAELAEQAYLLKKRSLHRKYQSVMYRKIRQGSDKWERYEEVTLGVLCEEVRKAADQPPVQPLDLPEAEHRYDLVISPTDLHWGLWAWDGAVGARGAYSREECERRLLDHTGRIVSRLSGRPRRILAPVGSDWFNTDGATRGTTRGTPQDMEGLAIEILTTGLDLHRRWVDVLRQVAPVDLFLQKGNHDEANSVAALLFLDAWYRDQDRVTTHMDLKDRVYTTSGSSLLGFTHGDGVKPAKLGALMAVEEPRLWGESRHRYMFTGHLHHHRVIEDGGIEIHLMPALAGHSQWAHKHGFVQARPALVGCLIDEDHGLWSWIKSGE